MMSSPEKSFAASCGQRSAVMAAAVIAIESSSGGSSEEDDYGALTQPAPLTQADDSPQTTQQTVSAEREDEANAEADGGGEWLSTRAQQPSDADFFESSGGVPVPPPEVSAAVSSTAAAASVAAVVDDDDDEWLQHTGLSGEIAKPPPPAMEDGGATAEEEDDGKVRCVVCNADISELSIDARTRHTNGCLDAGAVGGDGDEESTQRPALTREGSYACPICARDLTAETTQARLLHISKHKKERDAKDKARLARISRTAKASAAAAAIGDPPPLHDDEDGKEGEEAAVSVVRSHFFSQSPPAPQTKAQTKATEKAAPARKRQRTRSARDIEPHSVEDERLMLAQALSMSTECVILPLRIHLSPLTKPFFWCCRDARQRTREEEEEGDQLLAEGPEPKTDLAGFPVFPSPPKKPAFLRGEIFPEKKDGEHDPTPKFTRSTLLLQQQQQGVGLWQEASTGIDLHSQPTPPAVPTVAPTQHQNAAPISVDSSSSQSQQHGDSVRDPVAAIDPVTFLTPPSQPKLSAVLARPGESAAIYPRRVLGSPRVTDTKWREAFEAEVLARCKQECATLITGMKEAIAADIASEVLRRIDAEKLHAIAEIERAAVAAEERLAQMARSIAARPAPAQPVLPPTVPYEDTESQDVSELLRHIESAQTSAQPQQPPRREPVQQQQQQPVAAKPRSPESMTDAELKAAVKKFGRRPGSRASMIEFLLLVQQQEDPDTASQLQSVVAATSADEMATLNRISLCIRENHELFQRLLVYEVCEAPFFLSFYSNLLSSTTSPENVTGRSNESARAERSPVHEGTAEKAL